MALAAALVAALGGCAGTRLEGGVYRSDKGYAIRVPGVGWEIVPDRRADFALRRPDGAAAMLVNAACHPQVARRPLDLLQRHVLVGLRERAVLVADRVSVNGTTASHAVLGGRMAADDRPVRLELYLLKDERCVYDLLYVAEPAAFDRWRPDFGVFVDSFTVGER
jgi:hypothetical protein